MEINRTLLLRDYFIDHSIPVYGPSDSISKSTDKIFHFSFYLYIKEIDEQHSDITKVFEMMEKIKELAKDFTDKILIDTTNGLYFNLYVNIEKMNQHDYFKSKIGISKFNL